MSSTEIDFGLPSKLQKYVDDLRNINDDRLRYQQLLFLASKCEPLDVALKIEGNKVPGCLSTVHIHAINSNNQIYFKGDSDAQLTKGLVALLVNGLSGCTNDEIQKVKPEFIQYAGIANSLTPGRNNGFLNMLRVMKMKANELASSASTDINNFEGKIFQSIKTKLSMLKPSFLEISDDSSRHAGHSGVADVGTSETHFAVKIVADCFQGLTPVQRHKMIYALLSAELAAGVHALSISAKTPQEIS
jgi:sulfur transfer protein SufE/stress-induced morphogen